MKMDGVGGATTTSLTIGRGKGILKSTRNCISPIRQAHYFVFAGI